MKTKTNKTFLTLAVGLLLTAGMAAWSIFGQSNITVSAQEEPEAPPELYAETEGTSVYFTDPESDVTFTLETTNNGKKGLHGRADKDTKAPKHVEMNFGKSDNASTTATIKGLNPNTQYHLYKDSYENHQAFIADAAGTYSFTQDTSEDHNVWIQEEESNTVYVGTDRISPDGTSCAWSSTTGLYYGDWDGVNTCMLNMDVYENFEITTNNVTLDCDVYSITGSGSGYGVYLDRRTGVTVENCTVSGFYNGIYLYWSPGNTLSSNTVSGNVFGISLGPYANRNTLSSNTVSGNGYYGIGLGLSFYNSLTDNTVSGNSYGIYLSGSLGNTLSSNTVSGNNSYGIYLSSSSGNTLSSNTASGNSYGIWLYSSSSNTLSSNTVSGNANTGIFLYNNVSSGNTLSSNTVSGNSYGIYLWLSSDNSLTDNTVSGNNSYGIYLYGSSDNSLMDNTVGNSYYGIQLFSSSSNTLSSNTVSGNNSYGIYLSSSSGNIIYNNLFNNTQNVYASGSNQWNIDLTPGTNIVGGPNLGGNFWATPDGDGFSETCSDADADFICDSPFALSSNNVDNLPLTAYQPNCGNGVLDLGEECDDGNRVSGDGCSGVMCKIECIDPDDDGYGTEGNEDCPVPGVVDNCPDIYNPDQEDEDSDGVGNACDVQTCGNGSLETPGSGNGFEFDEECDDGNTVNGDGCSALCELECIDPDGDGFGTEGNLGCPVPGVVDQCPNTLGSTFGCPSGLRVSVQEVDASTKPATFGDEALTTKVFDATAGSCADDIGIKPINYEQIFGCAAENTQQLETNSPDDLVRELEIIGALPGDKFVLVRSRQSLDETFAFIGFTVPSLTAGETRDLGFNIAPAGSSTFTQTAHFTKDSKGKWHASRKQMVRGSVLNIIYPEYSVWTGTEELYPFVFNSDSDWTVDVCLEVPEGYVIAEPGECGTTFVNNETKVIEFKAVEVSSPPPNMKAKIKVKHKGKVTKIDLDIPGKRKGKDKDDLPGLRKGQASLSQFLAAQVAEEAPDEGAAIEEDGGLDRNTILLIVLALIVIGGVVYVAGRSSKK